MNIIDLNVLTELSLTPPAALVATTTGTGVDLQQYEGILKVVQEVGVVSGTLPTWDGKLQDSADNASGWTDIVGATFPQVIATTSLQSIGLDTRLARRYVRYVGTIGGSATPTFNVSARILGGKKNMP